MVLEVVKIINSFLCVLIVILYSYIYELFITYKIKFY